MGRVRERRWALREAGEVVREWRVGEASAGAGGEGGGIAVLSASSWEESRVEVGANADADVVLVTKGATGARSAAEERRRIS